MSRSEEIDRLEREVVRIVMASDIVQRSASRRDVRVIGRHIHRGSLGIELEVSNGSNDSSRRLFAKTMRAHSWDRYADERAGHAHPRLRRVPEPGSRLACEGSTLRRIAEMVADAHDPGFFAVTVAESMPDEGVLLLDHVDRPTLSACIAGEADIDRQSVVTACRNAGRWLRRFHAIEPPEHTKTGTDTNAALCAMVDEFARYLRSTPGAGWSKAMDALLERVKPALQPTTFGVGHGDFAAHNVFVGNDGSIGVFDTHAPLVLPVEFDLAYFVMMLQFADLKSTLPSHNSQLDRTLEDALYDGYGLTDTGARASLAPYEVLVLLDRWCSYAAIRGSSSSVREAAKRVRRRVFIRRIRTAVENSAAQIDARS